MKYCHACKAEWEGSRQPLPRETCPGCSRDMHVCLNCSFYDARVSNQCTENDAEAVPDKERFNFCDAFRFADRTPRGKAPCQDEAIRAKEQWKKLFKK